MGSASASTDQTQLVRQVERLLSEVAERGVIPRKARLRSLVRDHGFEGDQAGDVLEAFRKTKFVRYSRSSPVGYSLNDALGDPAELAEKLVDVLQGASPRKTRLVRSRKTLGPRIESLVEDIVLEELIPRKSDLRHYVLEHGFTRSEAKHVLEAFRESGLIEYSRSSPRGYSYNRAKGNPSEFVDYLTAHLQEIYEDHKPDLLSENRPDEADAEEIGGDQPNIIDTCPMCASRMNVRPIRCGPERVIKVNYCGFCHYFVPV